MVRTNMQFLAVRRNDEDGISQADEASPPGSGTTRDPLDDLIADLEDQANVWSLRPAQSGTPQDEDADLEGVEARELASKFAPSRKPRARVRRRMRRPKDRRWAGPEEQDVRDNDNSEHYSDRWASSHLAMAPPGIRHKWIWGMSTGLLLIASISVVLVFVGPLNGLLPTRVGDTPGKPAFDQVNPVDILAEVDKVRKNIVSNDELPTPKKIVDATPPRPVKTITIRPEVEMPIAPSTVGSVVIGSQANALATAGGRSPVSDGNITDLDPFGGAAEESAKPQTTPAKTDDRQQLAALRPIVQDEPEILTRLPTTTPATNPTPTVTSPPPPTVTPTVTPPQPPTVTSAVTPRLSPTMTPATTPTLGDEPVSNITAPVELDLSAAMIDSLLARGETLLRQGNVASARLVFLRAAAAGDLRGARGVGMTYDPDVYARLPVTGLKPDREQAENWYSRAGENSIFMTLDEKTVQEPDPVVAEAEQRHAACARKYRSYNAETGLYKSYRGIMRPCRLP